MALWDSADLLEKCRAEAQEPEGGTSTTDAQWYALLTTSQHKVVRLIAMHAPHAMVTSAFLTKNGDGESYSFPDGVYPLGYAELRDGHEGPVLYQGPNWSHTADFTLRGNVILFPPNFRSREFSGFGLFAWYVPSPSTISASVEPTLKPEWARILMVYDAVKEWAGQGGLRDPSIWAQKFQHTWAGDPAISGDVGIMGALKTQFRNPGIDGLRRRGRWW